MVYEVCQQIDWKSYLLEDLEVRTQENKGLKRKNKHDAPLAALRPVSSQDVTPPENRPQNWPINVSS
jgi:hypothetical protein